MKSITLWLFPILLLLPAPSRAQQVPSEASAPESGERFRILQTPGSPLEDRIRTEQLRSPDAFGKDAFLLRAPSHADDERSAPGAGWHLAPILPEFRAVWNSDLPFSLNDGALWAGRGWNVLVRGGIHIDRGAVTAIVAPQIVHSRNRSVQIIPSAAPGRSDYASPWYSGEYAIDLPLRFGNAPLTHLDPGQSSVTVRLGAAAFGIATENQWWGPGARNGLVLSNDAAGFPHLFLRTRQPIRTGLGTFRAKWILGSLTESLFFDDDPGNDHRSLSGLVVTFTPRFEPDLTLGLARTVVAGIGGRSELPLHLLDTFRHWRTDAPADQISSLFLRWIFPDDGLETYLEWSRLEMPTSIRAFLVAPHHTQGYTLGAQWARTLRSEELLRVQGEITYLEMSATHRQAAVPSYYVGRSTAQGYTHRGKLLGAAIGPGSSSQWLALDYLAGPRQLGIFAGRIRWNTDAYYSQRTGFSFRSHDVSIHGGVRGAFALGGAKLGVTLTGMQRYNYLFQNHGGGYLADPAWDRQNLTLELSLFPNGMLPSR